MHLAELIETIDARRSALGRPMVVGVSGYCGSGKSTLVRALLPQVTGAVRIRGDDFLDPARSHLRSVDWDGVDRSRLVRDVLLPVREQRSSMFRRYDWAQRKLGAPEPVVAADVVIVDLIGLFHPEALGSIDLTVWCDVDLETAVCRGMARDAALGRQHDALWRDVWLPNEIDFAARFLPRTRADVLVTTAFRD
jgi:uridine kinase